MSKFLICALFIIFFLILSADLFAQTFSIVENKATFSVGFKTDLTADKSRKFKFVEQLSIINRPIRLFIWYPAKKTRKKVFLKFRDYIYAGNLTKKPDQLTLSEKNDLQKKLAETLNYFNVTNEQVSSLMETELGVIENASENKGIFPLIVLGNVGEGFYYASMAEFLASNGYVVVTLPSLGANEGEGGGYDLYCLNLQLKDMEFAIEKMRGWKNVDTLKIGLVAWSFSGLTVSHLQIKNSRVKAVVSLDAATGYQYGKEILNKSTEFVINKTNVPFLHFHGLGGTSRVPKNFEFFHDYQSKVKHLVAMKNLQHSDFISLYGIGVRFAKKENNEKALAEIQLVNSMTLEFLNANLKNNPQSLKKFNVMKRSL